MSKAVLTTQINPTYDDLPEQRYHFPRTYLRQIEAALGDWIIYYEPRRPSGDLMKSGGKQAYFATARIVSIVPDPAAPDHFYALIEEILPFDHAVPIREARNYYEVDLILAAGIVHVLGKRDRERPALDPVEEARIGFGHNPQTPYEVDSIDRRIVSQIVQRFFRDRVFRGRQVGLSRHLRCHRPEADQWWRALGGAGRISFRSVVCRIVFRVVSPCPEPCTGCLTEG